MISTELLQAIRKMRFEEAYDGWTNNKINQEEAARLLGACEYYNYEIPGLGDTFLTELLNALDRIGDFPEAWIF